MAGMANGRGKLDDRPVVSRPGLHAQQSSSVPSTPYQRPRDLDFHSRSPSPPRGVSNHSPRSAVSETIVQSNPYRPPQRACVFETGVEIRKRRIPYVEGGNEELGPPKKELKKMLDPDEQDKLSGDMRELYDRLLPSAESEERRAQLVMKLERLLNEESGNDIRVNVFGSSGNLLSSTDSDVDICLTTPPNKLESMHSLAALLHRHGMEKVICRAAAKVPIVKCWDPALQLAADLNVNNTLALHNTRMIKTYVQIDDRVRPLAKIIKYWTKQRILNDAAYGGTISSYTWICLIISFLQRREPPILPSLQKLEGHRLAPESGDQPSFADDVDALKGWGSANTESLGELLFQFFRHYGFDFEYSKYVVSVKEGRLLSREEKGWQPSNYHDKESRSRLCVEEPFTLNRNLGNSADDYAWSGVHGEVRRAYELLADGCQLDKCCEQYEFPPEEKPIFQRPAPKPKPTLTRSASQSGRSNVDAGSGRSRKGNNRNSSSQRAGNRRASSGASFSNQRAPLPFNFGGTASDYFAAKGTLHEHLYQQYQILQAQQDALRSQLAHSATQSQAQARVGDLASIGASPRHRSYANGLPSPRYLDNAPQTAPLLPGSLYHFPARYPPPSPMSQARSREGTSTNPSSPSLMAAVPAMRRQAHRASVTDSSTSSARSQSQPGRSLPHPLTLQQHVHPGYDVSGALPTHLLNPRSAHGYPHVGLPFSIFPFPGLPQGAPIVDSAMPKEYVGYYVGQSPQLGPQYAAVSPIAPIPLTLRDPPPRQRRVTPDLMPPTAMLNGRHTSRSPSPLGRLRSFSTAQDPRSIQPQATTMQSPSPLDQPSLPPPLPAAPADLDHGGPVIVNGSNYRAQPQRTASTNGMSEPSLQSRSDLVQHPKAQESTSLRAPPLRTDFTSPERVETTEAPSASPGLSPMSRGKPGPRFIWSANDTPPNTNGASEQYHETAPHAGPLLSPVAEQPTPSPTRSRGFDAGDSPKAHASFGMAAKIASANQAEKDRENRSPADGKHERKGSAASLSPPGAVPANVSNLLMRPLGSAKEPASQNLWQQATRKGHKKSKSSVAAPKSPSGPGGQALPVNEADRKGG